MTIQSTVYYDGLFGKNFTVIERRKPAMTKNTKLIEALETIAEETDVPVKEIIDLLTGFCWDEEEGYELKDWSARRV